MTYFENCICSYRPLPTKEWESNQTLWKGFRNLICRCRATEAKRTPYYSDHTLCTVPVIADQCDPSGLWLCEVMGVKGGSYLFEQKVLLVMLLQTCSVLPCVAGQVHKGFFIWCNFKSSHMEGGTWLHTHTDTHTPTHFLNILISQGHTTFPLSRVMKI